MFAFVGGYTTTDRNGSGPGITVWRTGSRWERLHTVEAGENPSFLRFGPGDRILYAAHGGRREVSAWAVDPGSGALSPRGRAPCGGVNPVDLHVWPGRDALLVVNYTSGTAAALPLGPGGEPLAPAGELALVRDGHPGPSMPHGIAFDPSGRFALVPDKGLDCVHVLTLGPALELQHHGLAACDPGSGPRHCAFHPALPVLFVVTELGCSVQSFAWDAGALRPIQTVRSLPPGAAGVAAEIAVSADGHSVYASNRGDDTIAHFAVDAEGRMGPAACVPCGGAEPRFFALAPGAVLVCCQDSHRIVALPVGPDGRPGAAGMVVAEVNSPTALCVPA